MKYINPSDELKIQLADTILNMLDRPGRTLPASYITSKDEDLRKLAKNTPVLYLKINKS